MTRRPCEHVSRLDALDGVGPCPSCDFETSVNVLLDTPLPGTSWDSEHHTSTRLPWWRVELPFLLALAAGSVAFVALVLLGQDVVGTYGP